MARLDSVTAVVPAKDAAAMLPACLDSLAAEDLFEVVVVDGCSTDDSRRIARAHGATVISDGGRGVPVARLLGVEAAHTPYVLLVDTDVVLPPGAASRLLHELEAEGYDALQAGLESTSGPGYWGQALVHHHRTGRSRGWFGLVATVMRRDTFLAIGVDPAFASGEDIDLRWRLRAAGRRIGVSEAVVVEHRFAGDDWAFARSQFLMDGAGLGRMVRRRRGAWHLVLLPAAAAVRGILRDLVRGSVRWVPYFVAFAVVNYRGMARAAREG